ncbi:3-deoxy-D-manno-octulosonic acid kinase [Dokdonella sp.]|uniref:3-deoxy-D-manno-octulosonic acid kinase n=1 Tax=Dokdonella sp. TaxID=2291710 RepID=UPI0025B9EC4A|nr:3-deoxy-D-manno-octulosonic acid kinase [Dokdonella sp.]MBX3693295.1 3-deoxy-D-manno-octulosonic acid kinase [Dokdonella sp.]MCW5567444.1 3-deoxy-D-manno-octulosonic acid kinase [Dokdonella sp.]
MIEAQVQLTQGGAIIFDARLPERVDDAWFNAHGGAGTQSGGRGGVHLFDAPFGPCVLRHYRRGGLVARFNRDRYLYTGAERTRGFREFTLLARLHDAGLHVPAPVAARTRREGLWYRADLVTRRIVGATTLAERFAVGQLDAACATRTGQTIATFHARGVWHADLNAHNIMVDASGAIWLIDFDRGRLRAPAMAWQQANLARLHRSFLKIGAGSAPTEFDAAFWRPLLAAYQHALADRAATGSEA